MSRRSRRPRRANSVEQAAMAHAFLSAVIATGEGSTDDAHARFELPPSVEQRAWGAVTNRLLSDGVIHRVGDLNTRRAVAHARRIGRYRADAAALQYLAALAASAARPRAKQRTLFADVENETGSPVE